MATDAFNKFYDSFHKDGYGNAIKERFPEETSPSHLSQVGNFISDIPNKIDSGMKYIGSGIGDSINKFEANHPVLASKISSGLNTVNSGLDAFNNTAPAQALQATNTAFSNATGIGLLNKAINPQSYQKDQEQSQQIAPHWYSPENLIGGGIGYIAPFGAAGKVVGKLPVLAKPAATVLGRIGQAALKTGLEGLMVSAPQNAISSGIDYAQGHGTLGENALNALKRTGEFGVGSALFGAGGTALGEGISKGVNVAKDFLNKNSFENKFNDTFGGYKPSIEGFTPPTLPKYIPSNLKTGNLKFNAPESPIQPKYLGDKYFKPINTDLRTAETNLNDAIEQLQNKYQTKDIQGAVSDIVNNYAEPKTRKINVDNNFMIDYVKKNDGIDIPKLFDDIEQAQSKKLIPTPEQSRMQYIAGARPDSSYDMTSKMNDYLNKPKTLSEFIQQKQNKLQSNPVESNLNGLNEQGNMNLPPLKNNSLNDNLESNDMNSPMVAKNQSNIPSWAQDTIDRNYAIADKLGLSNEIEAMARQRLTGGEIVRNIKDKIPQGYDARELVNSVRAKRGIPSQDNSAEFEGWLKSNNINGAMGADKAIKLKQSLNQNSPIPSNYKYIDSSPIKFDEGLISDKSTAQSIRDSYSGISNRQTIIGNHLSRDIGRLAPKEQEALTFYNESNGDKNLMQSWLDSPDPQLEKYKPFIKQAMNLSPEAQKAAHMMKQYYTEQGDFSTKMGTIKGVIDNYNNRLYKPDAEGSPLDKAKKTEQIRTEIKNSGLNTNTKHSKERVYNTIVDAILGGKEPATLKANDLLSIHNEELARVNTNRKLADALQSTGFGGYVQGDKIPRGMHEIPSLSKGFGGDKYVVPEGIADGLRAITDSAPLMGKFGQALSKAQGVIKTVDLSFSLFHHITEAAQALYQGNGKALTKSFKLDSLIHTDSFRSMEKDFIYHTGITSRLEANQDVLKSLRGQDGLMGKISNLPGIKKITELSDKNSEYLFGKMQTYLKVIDYQNKVAKFIGKNPNVADEALTTTKRDIAKQINNAYGGLNWQSLGYTPGQIKTLRTWFLAPDWLISNVNLAKSAISESGQAGNLSRQHFGKAMLGSYLAGEALNKVLTGHWMHENDKGHGFEVQMAPNVYVSPLRGFGGEVEKLFSSMVTNGLVGGVAKYSQNKLAPLARTGLGIAANKDVTGGPIYKPQDSFLKKTASGTGYIAKSAFPIPIGISGTGQYLASGEATPLGTLGVGSGLARYSKSKKK